MAMSYEDYLARKMADVPSHGFKASAADSLYGFQQEIVEWALGRRFAGVELKRSYFDTACRNLADAEGQMSLLSSP